MKEIDNFTKNLKILFVEDDELTRKQFTKILSKIFTNIEVEANGLDGFLKFQEKKFKNNEFDLIISDIDMPRMSGIEMVHKIRELDTNVPVIFITAKNSSEILLNAIDLGVLNFVPKPVDIDKLIINIKKSCEKLYYQYLYNSKSNELEKYYSVIESVALVTRGDLNGNITYVNDNFCEATGYLREELIGKNHSIFKQKEKKDTLFYEKFWAKISSGQIWTGTFKNVDKNQEIFFRKATVVPVIDENENIIEYMSISFLTTEDEQQKRLLNEKLLKNIVNHKKSLSETEKVRDKYLNDVKALRNLVITLDNKIKKMQLEKLNQPSEIQLKELNDEQKLNILKQKNDEIQKVIRLNKILKEENAKILAEKRELEEKISLKDQLVESYKDDITRLKTRLK